MHPLSRRLERHGELVQINSRAFALLLALVARAGEIVEKDELLRAGWGGRIVAENNLTVHMAALRRALRDSDEAGQFILTEHGRGYRFVAPLVEERATLEPEPAGTAASHPPRTDARPFSVLILPFEGRETGAGAGDITRHLVLQLSRTPDAVVLTRADSGSEAARHVLRGTVLREGGTLRVLAFLDDAQSGATVWADRLDHRHLGLSSPEEEVAGRLARAVIIEIVDREARRSAVGTTVQDCALRGWSAIQRELLLPEDAAEARRWFDLALREDPQHAASLAGAAYAIAAEYQCLWNDDRRAKLGHADALAARAVARAPDWPRAWFCRGYVKIWQGQFDAALSAFDRALLLDPCDPLPHAYAGHVNFLMGRPEAMLAPIRKAIALSPRDRGVGLWHHWTGLHDFWKGDDEAAIPHFVRATDLAPGLIYPPSFLASALAHAGRIAEARRGLQAWSEAMGVTRFTIGRLREQVFSDHPTYLAVHERLYAGLRLLNVPEG